MTLTDESLITFIYICRRLLDSKSKYKILTFTKKKGILVMVHI